MQVKYFVDSSFTGVYGEQVSSLEAAQEQVEQFKRKIERNKFYDAFGEENHCFEIYMIVFEDETLQKLVKTELHSLTVLKKAIDGTFYWADFDQMIKDSLFIITTNPLSKDQMVFNVSEHHLLPVPKSRRQLRFRNPEYEDKFILRYLNSNKLSRLCLDTPSVLEHYTTSFSEVERMLKQLWDYRLELLKGTIEVVQDKLDYLTSSKANDFCKLSNRFSDLDKFKDLEIRSNYNYLVFELAIKHGYSIFEDFFPTELVVNNEESTPDELLCQTFEHPYINDTELEEDDLVFLTELKMTEEEYLRGFSFNPNTNVYEALEGCEILIRRDLFSNENDQLFNFFKSSLINFYKDLLVGLNSDYDILSRGFSYSYINQSLLD